MAHFHELKHEMNSSREAERSSLTTLTLQSDTAMKELQKKKEMVRIKEYPSKLLLILENKECPMISHFTSLDEKARIKGIRYPN